MKCLRKGCEGDLQFEGYAGMGTCHSNYYKCEVCGNVYLVYDHSSAPPRLISEGMKCLLCKLKYGNFKVCTAWGCPRKGWYEDHWNRHHKDCEYRLKWKDTRRTPKTKKAPKSFSEMNWHLNDTRPTAKSGFIVQLDNYRCPNCDKNYGEVTTKKFKHLSDVVHFKCKNCTYTWAGRLGLIEISVSPKDAQENK